LSKGSRHHVFCVNPRGWTGSTTIAFDAFDVVVIHYSIAILYDTYLPSSYRECVRRFRGLKALFIQDEYREVNAHVEAMIDLGIHVLFTCVPETAITPIYGKLRSRGVSVFKTLTGYVPEELRDYPVLPLAARPLDVVYRGREVPFELGNLGHEKIEIARRFREAAERLGLVVDVDWREDARIYGQDWTRFMASGKAALGTESGASIVDFDGAIARGVRVFRRRYPDASYSEVAAAVLAPHEGNLVVNVISPRAFEAICLRTALLLYPGEYSGILEPWRHYIPLSKNFSNIDEVARLVRDTDFLEELTCRAYQEIVASGWYSVRAFTREVDDVLAERWTALEPSQRTVADEPGFDPVEWRSRCDAEQRRLTEPPPETAPATVLATRPAASVRYSATLPKPLSVWRQLRTALWTIAHRLHLAAKSCLAIALRPTVRCAVKIRRGWRGFLRWVGHRLLLAAKERLSVEQQDRLRPAVHFAFHARTEVIRRRAYAANWITRTAAAAWYKTFGIFKQCRKVCDETLAVLSQWCRAVWKTVDISGHCGTVWEQLVASSAAAIMTLFKRLLGLAGSDRKNLTVFLNRNEGICVFSLVPADHLPRFGDLNRADVERHSSQPGVTAIRLELHTGSRWSLAVRFAVAFANRYGRGMIRELAICGSVDPRLPHFDAHSPDYSNVLCSAALRTPALVRTLHRLDATFGRRAPAPPYDLLAETGPDFPRPQERRSVVFLHHAYYNFYYLAVALRRRGWNALNVSLYPPDDKIRPYLHGEDLCLWDANERVRTTKIHEFFGDVRQRFNVVHFHGMGAAGFFPENWDVQDRFTQPPWDLLELKRSGVRIGYTECGCLDLVAQTDFRRWSGGMCDICPHQSRADICSDERNTAWGHKIRLLCDLICVEADPLIGLRLGPNVYREPLTLVLDHEFWRPDLPIPEKWRQSRSPGEVVVYHGVGNYRERITPDHDVKGSGAVFAAIDRLRSEGENVRLQFATDIPNKEVRYIQAQSDIIVDQLYYGRYGATAREGLMLGKPVVGRLNRMEEIRGAESQCISEAPIVHATVDTVYDVLKDLIRAPEKRRRIGQASRSYALKWWSADACAARYERVYDRMMAGRPVWPRAPRCVRRGSVRAG